MNRPHDNSIEPFSIITKDFSHADGDDKPVETIDYNESGNKNKFFAMAGKGKLCKGAGLTGADKRACAKKIKSTCGRKPLLGKAKKEKWAECAQGLVISPEESAKEAAEKLVPSTPDTGLGIGVKIMIAVSILGTLGLIGFAVSNRIKANKLSLATQVAGKI